MPGRVAPANPAEVARLYAAAEPSRSPFRRGLSYFPERPGAPVFNNANFGAYVNFGAYARPGLGDISTVVTDGAGIAGATAAGGPVGGGIALISDLASAFSSGTQRDKDRAARANYFGNLAVQGNVAAAQIILGALVPNVSGNELSMWQAWLSQLQSSASGQATLAAARQLGPYWPVGSTDTVTNYPIMKAFAQNWANAHPFAAGTGATVTKALSSPLPWLIGAGAIAFLLLRRR
jgi:hypothetical protein